MKQVCVEKRIEEMANTKIGGKLNLAQYKKEKERLMIHKSVCQQVLAYRDSNPTMPVYAILSAGISAGAFKNEEFNKGYKKFDSDKVNAVYQMANAYNKAMGKNGMPSDVLYRVCMKYYKKVSHNVADFMKSLETAKQMDTCRGNFEELCKNVGVA